MYDHQIDEIDIFPQEPRFREDFSAQEVKSSRVQNVKTRLNIQD